jgi:GMP synthase-like glutamine amidotransferase
VHGPDICIVDCGSRTTAAISRLCTQAGCPSQKLPLAQANSAHLNRHDGIIISGGPHYFSEPSSAALSETFAFIDRITKPLLGICLGHQAIGMRCGGSAFRGARRQGEETIRLHTRHPLVEGLGHVFTVREDHCEGILLPPHFLLLGDSAHYPVEIMAGSARPFFGVQFHPEVSGAAGELLFANFIGIVNTRRMKKD